MLKKITLTNFRKHTNLTVNYTEGLNAVRSPNEGGKSTLIEAVSYALFGSSALRSTLDEAVTWGTPTNKLKVELTFDIGGRSLTFVRGKSGAEVLEGNDVLVTGQKEVAAFAAELLGADATTANLLMFAEQGSLRGVLNDGPKATGGLLETLADMDLFDKILNTASEKLALGSATLYEERLTGLRQQREMLQLPPKPDEEAFKAQIADKTQKRDAFIKRHAEVSPILDRQSEIMVAESNKRRQRDTQREEVNRIQADIADKKQRIATLSIGQDVSDQIAVTKVEIEACAKHAERLAAYKAMPHLGKSLHIPFAEVTGRLGNNRATTARIAADLERIKGEIKVSLTLMTTAETCPVCGQDVSKSERIAAKNAELKAKIDQLTTEADGCNARHLKASQVIEEYEALLQRHNAVVKVIDTHRAYYVVDESVTPFHVEWNGRVPSDETPVAPVEQLKHLEALQKARTDALAQMSLLNNLVEELSAKQHKLLHQMDEVPMMPDEEFAAGLKEQERLFNIKCETGEARDALDVEMRELTQAHEQAMKAWQYAAAQMTRIEAETAKTEADLRTLAFNNTLVKKIRAARPVVTGKLWNMVLSSVSSLFSKMRGEHSVVTRGEKGFLVNNQAVESLSGSASDLLGLAIRVALVKTFVPNASFIVLDEPTAACDANRTEALIGFVASCGFKQTLLITHEEISTAFADHIIQLA